MYNINININCDAAVNIVNGFFIRACEKKSVNSVFYDYIFTYPAL